MKLKHYMLKVAAMNLQAFANQLSHSIAYFEGLEQIDAKSLHGACSVVVCAPYLWRHKEVLDPYFFVIYDFLDEVKIIYITNQIAFFKVLLLLTIYWINELSKIFFRGWIIDALTHFF